MSQVSTAQVSEVAVKLGLDVTKIDWQRWIQIVLAIIAMLQQQPPTPKMACPACPDDCCDQHQCCLDSVKASSAALEAAIACYHECCVEPATCND